MKLIVTILTLGQLLMAATLSHIDLNTTKIPLILEEDKRLPLINLQLIFRVSGSIEDGDKPGLAKLSAALLNEGTATHGATKFAEILAADAIHLSAHAGTETFVIELSALKEKKEKALMRLAELLLDPNLTPTALQSVKVKALGRLKSKQDDFDYIAQRNLKKILFANTPLANPADGTKESIEAISLEDVKNFLHTHLVLARTIVAYGGDVNESSAKEELPSVLKLLKKGSDATLPFYEANDNEEKLIEHKETKQAYIYFGSPYHMRYDDAELYIAKVAAFILGSGGFGSRLMEEIRVKHGLAYSAYARIHINKSHTYFSGYMQTKLESQEEAWKLSKKIIEEFVANGATEEELKQTKRFLLGSEPLRNETMSQRLHKAFMEYYKGFPLGHSKEELKKIEALDLASLNAFIKKHKEIEKLSLSIVTK